MPRESVLDVDYGSGTPTTKQAAFVNTDEFKSRADDRAGLRQLDAMTEQNATLSRASKDRARILPRETTAPLGDPRMERRIPDSGPRKPLSSRQKNARSRTRHRTESQWTNTELQMVGQLTTKAKYWQRFNDALSGAAGDLDQIDDGGRKRIQRIDRAIQRYEKNNDRGHVIYLNAKIPTDSKLTHSKLVQAAFPQGRTLDIDRFSLGAHQLHEISAAAGADTIALEVQTRRGAYLGGSDKRDDTTHLLPRGMRLEVIGVQHLTYTRPDGSTGTRLTVQARDITPEPSRQETTHG